MTTKSLHPCIKMEVDAPAEKIWQLLLDWGALADWTPDDFVKECRLEGEGVGAVRYVTRRDGHVIAERLDKVDLVNRVIDLSIIEGAPGGISNYHARTTLEPVDDNHTIMTWEGMLDIPEETDEARQKKIKEGFETSYKVVIECAAAAANKL